VPDLRDARLLFSGDRLALARQLRGITRAELAGLVGVTPAAVSQYESNQITPRIDTIARIALSLGVPPEFVTPRFQPRRLVADEWHFRSLRATRKRERDRVLARVTLLVEITDYIERYVELPAPNLPEHLVDDPDDPDAIEAAATAVRALWQLESEPIVSMVRLLELRGCLVARIVAESEAMDAFSGRVGGRPFVILAMDKADSLRSRFDAAHELGHLLIHADVNPGSAISEKQAHRFASSFLLPREAIGDELPARVDWTALVALKARWGVSIAALLYRAYQIGKLPEPAYRRAMTDLNARGWRRNEPGAAGWSEAPTVLTDALDLLERARGLGRASLISDLHFAPGDYDSVVEPVQRMNVVRLSDVASTSSAAFAGV